MDNLYFEKGLLIPFPLISLFLSYILYRTPATLGPGLGNVELAPVRWFIDILIFKLMSTATASVTNKTWIFKKKLHC